MNDLIQSFLGGIAADAFKFFDETVKLALNQALNIESSLDVVFGANAVTNVSSYIYLLACALLAIKFCQRGFSIYILWRDGDADSSPRDMVMGVVQGVVMAATFPYLYELLVDVAVWFYESVLNMLRLSSEILATQTLQTLLGFGILQVIIVIIYIVAGLILWLHMIKRGFELFILRIAFPLACIGLVNSDGGIFKAYTSTIIKSILTLIVQCLLMSLSFRLITTLNGGGLMVGIAALMTAYSVPTLFQQFLVSGQGANVTNKIYSAARLVQMAGGLKK